MVVDYTVSVWNCRAALVRWVPAGNGGWTFEPVEPQPPEEMLWEAVYEAGGAMNISGHYPLTPALRDWVESRVA